MRKGNLATVPVEICLHRDPSHWPWQEAKKIPMRSLDCKSLSTALRKLILIVVMALSKCAEFQPANRPGSGNISEKVLVKWQQ